MRFDLIHIPKTGATALGYALRDIVTNHHPRVMLEDVDGPAIVIVRDPIARFVSAFDMAKRLRSKGMGSPVIDRWDDASRLALDLPLPDVAPETMKLLFSPQVRWLRDAEYVRQRVAYVLHTETLDDDYARLGEPGMDPVLPGHLHPFRNEGKVLGGEPSILTPEAVAALEEWYADDIILVGSL